MHTIRLRGPWEKRIGDRTSTRVSIPDTTVSQDGDAVIRYGRKFNLPTGLGQRDRVLLQITRWSGQLDSARLNDHPIPLADPPLEVDITLLLQPHNQLVLEMSRHSTSLPCLCGEVALQIENRDDC